MPSPPLGWRGYVREGVLRSVYFKQGQRRDFEIWSRLPKDPEPS
jgi:hypothetical protein